MPFRYLALMKFSLLTLAVLLLAMPVVAGKITEHTIKTTTETGFSVTAPLVVATLAFISGLASLIMSWWSAYRIKQQEYKNDYFKKVIDFRLHGIKVIEEATALLRLRLITQNEKGEELRYHSFFTLEDDERSVFKDAVTKASHQVIWHAEPTAQAFTAFIQTVSLISKECRGLDRGAREARAATEYEKVNKVLRALHIAVSTDMLILYDVEAFFKSKL